MTATETSKADQRVAMRWIPQEATRIDHPSGLGVCYTESKTTHHGIKYNVLAFIGTAQKSAFYESYRTAELRDKRVADFFTGLDHGATYKAERKAERAKAHDLTVGEIIYNSWGYDQTNIDWYVIVKRTDHFVWLQPIAGHSIPSDGVAPMAGYTEPELPVRQILTREVRDYGEYDEAIGHRPVTLKTVPVEPTMRKAEGKSVLFKHGCGCVWDGKPKYESWYA